MWRWIRKRKWAVAVLALVAFVLCAVVTARVWMRVNARHRVFMRASSVPKCKVALVLGAGVHPDGTCSKLLRDRLDRAIELYRAGRVEKLLMTGDNRVSHYNEPERMREYALAHGVPDGDVRCDYAGRRTYDSIYRAKHIFGQNRLVLVSQGWHLDRALFLADGLDVEACGFAGRMRCGPLVQIRETAACLSAVLDVYLLKPTPVMGKRERI